MTVSVSVFDLLRGLVEQGASDLHLKAGSPPGYRLHGGIVPQSEHGILGAEDTERLLRELMSPEQWKEFEEKLDIDFAMQIPGCARFRVNALTQRGAPGLVARVIPDKIPSAEDLGLPEICLDLASKPRGLVLVTGPTGSGKSTTLAAMIDHINRTESGHILTMEDPLEFMHPDKQCYVTQRNIGSDCTSFREALRRALRQDPDVILIGEMRDLETISMAISAAETGHLVFGTLHTTSAISTVDRIIDVFPTDQQQQVRVQLATTLQGVISQCLVKKQGGGRVAAHEILVATDGVRSLVREGKTTQILNLLQTGRGHGMTTLEASLANLVNSGQIRYEDAIQKANRAADVEREAKAAGGAQGASGGSTTRSMDGLDVSPQGGMGQRKPREETQRAKPQPERAGSSSGLGGALKGVRRPLRGR